MLGYFKELFKHEDVLEQTKAGKWKKIHRYKNFGKIAAFFAGIIIFFLSIALSLWIFFQEELIPLPIANDIQEELVQEIPAPPPAIPEPEIAAVAFEPLLTDIKDAAFSADVKRFTSRTKPNSMQNELWIQIKKKDGKLVIYEKMAEGNKEIGNWDVSANEVYVPTGDYSVQMVHNAERWTHDFGNGVLKGAYGPWFIRLGMVDGITFGIHGTLDHMTDKRVSIGVQMKNADLIELERFVFPKMRIVIEE